jgi:putative PIN family toxin of toxin-antitoxin system
VKVVLDTNVLLAAFATRGLCEAVLTVCLDGHQIILSEPILTEASKNLTSKFKMPAAQVRQIIDFLRENAELVEPQPVPADSCRDPKDLVILGTAAAGGADCLVSGDEDLLILKQFRTIPILSPRAFYDKLV